MYRNDNCFRSAPLPMSLRGSLADEVAQRPGEMRLIEIARLKDRVEDGRALPQENRRIAGALDLANGAMCQPGRTQESPLCGAQREVARSVPVASASTTGLEAQRAIIAPAVR